MFPRIKWFKLAWLAGFTEARKKRILVFKSSVRIIIFFRSPVKNIPNSWIGRSNIIKMTILPKTIYRLNTIPIQIATEFFTELEKPIHMKPKETWNSQSKFWATRAKQEALQSDFKLYYETTTIVKTGWSWHTNRGTDKGTRVEDMETTQCTFIHLTFDKGAKIMHWRKDNVFSKLCWKTGYPCIKEWN